MQNGDIAGLEGPERAIVASLVRYHTRKSEPARHHAAYTLLCGSDQRTLRRLASLLRLAEALDHSHRERIGAIGLQIQVRGDAREDLLCAVSTTALFEKEFRVKLLFRQAAV